MFDVQRGGQLDHPLWLQAEEPAEPDELGPDRSLELVQLCDRTRLDQLLEAGRDSRPDAA